MKAAMPDAATKIGTVKRWSEQRGCGFLMVEGEHRGVFAHISQVMDEYPKKGDRVIFEEDTGGNERNYARRVVVIR
jgi:cold shock CspA family protein